MSFLKRLKFYLPIFLSACLLQVQLSTMNGLHFEVNVGIEKSYADSECVNEEGARGADRICDIKDTGVEKQGEMIAGMWITNLVNWAVAAVMILMVYGCSKATDMNTCGWSSLTALGTALAFMAAEIVNIAYHRQTLDNIQYRGMALNKYKDQCQKEYDDGVYDDDLIGDIIGTSTPNPESEVGDAGSIRDDSGNVTNVCGQYAAIMKQKEAFESMYKGAEWKRNLLIAAAGGSAAGAFMEFQKQIKIIKKLKVSFIKAQSTSSTVLSTSTPLVAALRASNNDQDANQCQKYANRCSNGLITSGLNVELLNITLLNPYLNTQNEDTCKGIMKKMIKSLKPLKKCHVVFGEASVEVEIDDDIVAPLDESDSGGITTDGKSIQLDNELVGEIESVVESENISLDEKTEELTDEHLNILSAIDLYMELRTLETELERSEILTNNNCIQSTAQAYEASQYFTDLKNLYRDLIDMEKAATSLSHCEMVNTVEPESLLNEAFINKEFKKDFNKDFKNLDQMFTKVFSVVTTFFLGTIALALTGSDTASKQISGNNVSNLGSFMTFAVGAVLIVLVGLLIPKVRTWIAKIFATPLQRGIVNLVSGALAGGTAAATEFLILRPIQENIDKLNDILDGYEVNENKVLELSNNVMDTSYQEIPPEQFPDPIVVDENRAKNGCGKSTTGDGKGGCKTVSAALASSFPFSDFGSVGSLAKQSATFSHGLEKDGTIDQADLNAINNVAAKRDALDRKVKQLMKSSAFRKYAGDPAKINKIADNIVARLKSDFQKTLDQKGVKLDELFGKGNSKEAKKAREDKLKRAKRIRKRKIKIIPNKTDDPFEFNFKDEKNSGLALDSDDDGSLEEQMYHNPEGGIWKNDAGNIFKKITTRYMKSAYPVFFDEDQLISNEKVKK